MSFRVVILSCRASNLVPCVRSLLANEPDLPWAQIAGMRDRLAHRYFDTSHVIVAATVEHELPELERATRSLLDRVQKD